jgi:imidazole glycerol phosphate synthase subunit HisF
MEQEVVEKSAVPHAGHCMTVRRLRQFAATDAATIGADDFVFDASGVEAVADACAGIVLAQGDEQRAATLLSIGAPLVLLGEAALRDSGIVQRLAAAFGGERIGVYAPVRRQAVSWGFESVSNADFRTVTPSHCEPAWEVLLADGAPTGTLVAWWLTALRDLGATQFLVQPAIDDDIDLNLCADLVERLDSALWLIPAVGGAVPLADWVRYGQARQLALPDGMAMEAQLA